MELKLFYVNFVNKKTWTQKQNNSHSVGPGYRQPRTKI